MRSHILVLALFAMTLAACNDADSPPSPAMIIDPRALHVGTCTPSAARDGPTNPVKSMDEARAKLGWDPLDPGRAFPLQRQGISINPLCDGTFGVQAHYEVPGSEFTLIFLQGSGSSTVEVGPAGQPVRIGKYEVQFLDVPDYGVGVFQFGDYEQEILYATVIADNRAIAHEFIRALR